MIDPAVPGTPGDAGPGYSSYGFAKSFRGVWSPESLRFYSDQKLSGRELHPALGQDVHRMGGDLLLDASGHAVLCHYSKTNTDRPDVKATVLPLMRALATQVASSRRRSVGEILAAFGCGFFLGTCLHPLQWADARRKVFLPAAALLLSAAACASMCSWPLLRSAHGGQSWEIPLELAAAQAGDRPDCKS
mmetsp:Transcript_24063/g.55579  ORF Transcript_24063/g.55579 Transcript_24063/m.55579 type:complete len:190 (-) Transcript_24063:93-662(-)